MTDTRPYYLDPDKLDELQDNPNEQDLLSEDPAYQAMSESIDIAANDPVLEGF